MIALGGPKLKLVACALPLGITYDVSMIALGGPKLKLGKTGSGAAFSIRFNDSTGWA